MKKHMSAVRMLLILLCMSIAILDSETTVAGSYEGTKLCLQVIVPSLFPFILLSILLTPYTSGVKFPFVDIISKVFHIPESAIGLLLTGFLGGYPAGAKCIQQSFDNGAFDKDTAGQLLCFCNNCGPAFIFGIAPRIFGDPRVSWALWSVHILSALCVAVLLSAQHGSVVSHRNRAIRLTDGLKQCTQTMAGVCGWVMVFRILLAFLDKYLPQNFHPIVRIALSGALELSNGCLSLRMLDNAGMRFLLFECFVSFGGICVLMQTMSIVSPSLPRYRYLLGKILQSGISVLLAYPVQFFIFSPDGSVHLPWYIWLLLTGMVVIPLIFLRKNKISSRILLKAGV